jgi:ligand-binding sensor domain-containing protein
MEIHTLSYLSFVKQMTQKARFGLIVAYWRNLITCLCCAFVCLFISAVSTHAQYRFEHWTTDNGLPQNSVFGITQTRDGYLWLATGDGLVRFDGLRFTVFDQSNSKGLGSNRFVNLYQDKEGSLWAGTEDAGLMRYQNGEFRMFTESDGLPDRRVLNIRDDSDGGLLFQSTKRWAQFRDGKFNALPVTDIYPEFQIYVGQSGSRWTWRRTGLTQSKNGLETVYQITLDARDYIDSLYEDRDGALWLASTDFKVFRAKDGVVTTYTAEDGVPGDHRIVTIYQDREGNVWFGTDGAGLINFKDGRFTTYTPDGLTGTILTIFEDREGTLWLGTTTGGLFRLTR